MDYNKWPKSILALMEYSNIYFRILRLEDFFVNSALQKWPQKYEIYDPQFRQYLSHLVQILLSFKYGGTCLNADYLILRNLHAIGFNWISDQDDSMILDFRHFGFGHVITHETLK